MCFVGLLPNKEIKKTFMINISNLDSNKSELKFLPFYFGLKQPTQSVNIMIFTVYHFSKLNEIIKIVNITLSPFNKS